MKTSKVYRITGSIALALAAVFLLFGAATFALDIGDPYFAGIQAIFAFPCAMAGAIAHTSASDAEKEGR